MSVHLLNQRKISALYVAVFNRAPDKAGLDFWSVQATANPATVFNTIAAGFSQHPVFSEVYASLNGSAYVNALYTNILGSSGDAGGVAFWTNQLTAGRTKSEVLAAFVQSSLETNLSTLILTPAELAAAQIRQQTITNKANVGVQFATLLGTASNLATTTNPSTLAGLRADPAYLASVAVISNVSHVASTASNAIANISVAAASGNPIAYLTPVVIAPVAPVVGQTFTLTANTDSIPGTAGDDTISGVLQGLNLTGTTIQPGDVINGAGGTDTLSITIAGAAGATAISAVQTTSVEKVLVNNFSTDGGGNAISTDLMEGVTTVGLRSSSATGDTSFTGMRALVGAELRNGAGDLTLTYASAAVAGTADTQALTVSNLSAGTFTANGAESIAITSELVKSKMASVASDKLKTLVVVGNQDLEITTAIDFVAGTNNDTTIDATIDASTFTGKLTVGADENDTQIKGGSGDDTFKMGAFLTKNDKIDGGAGKDTLTMTAAALTDQFAGVSNVEVVGFDAATASLAMDVSKLSAGVTDVSVDLSDGNDNIAAVTATISKLNGQKVTLNHTVANVGDDTDADGANVIITNATDTSTDTVNIVLNAIGLVTANKLGFDSINVASFETVNLESKKSTTVTANEVLTLTDDLTTALNITGDAALTITQTGTKLTNVNASQLAAKLNITLGANKVSVTGTANDDTFVFAGNLNNDDTVVGGAGKDTLTASVSGLNVTTGVLRTNGVEVITLTTGGDNTLDLTNVVGATSVSVSGSTQTITGLDLATKLIVTGDATLKVTAANATGANDTLTVEQNTAAGAANVIEAKGGAIENLSIIMTDTQGDVHTGTFTLTNFEGKSVTASQSATSGANSNVALGTMNKSVNAVNTSGIKGTQAFSLASATAATTVTLGGSGVATVTGSAFADTFNIGSTTAAVHLITGGDGTDTVNITMADTAAADYTGLNVEKVNITVAAGADVTVANTKTFAVAAVDITVSGGNAASTYKQGPGNTIATTALLDGVKTFNASTFGGNIEVAVVNDKFDDTVTVTGGALTTDSVQASYVTAGTFKPRTAGVEILKVSAGNNATAENIILDLSNTTGVSTVEVNNIATNAIDTVVVDKITNQKVVVTGSALNGNVIEAKLSDASGAADALTVELKAASVITDTLALKITDIETVNLKADVAATVSLANVLIVEASKFATLNVTGNTALTISALNADVNVINASGMGTGGSVVQNARSGTSAATYTGSAGADRFIMNNAADAINGGSGTDMLDIDFSAILGGIQVNLASTTDQVTTLNGSANAAIQVGFENVDLSGYTGTFGADITAAATGSVITGTANVDQITLGSGADIVVLSSTLTTSDTIIGFTVTGTADKIDINAAATGTGITAGGLTSGSNLNGGGGGAVAISRGMTTIADNVTGALTAASIFAVVTGGANDLTLANADNVVYIAIDNGTDTAIARINGAAGNVVIDQAEITIIATLSGVADATSLVAANFVDFA